MVVLSLCAGVIQCNMPIIAYLEDFDPEDLEGFDLEDPADEKAYERVLCTIGTEEDFDDPEDPDDDDFDDEGDDDEDFDPEDPDDPDDDDYDDDITFE